EVVPSCNAHLGHSAGILVIPVYDDNNPTLRLEGVTLKALFWNAGGIALTLALGSTRARLSSRSRCLTPLAMSPETANARLSFTNASTRARTAGGTVSSFFSQSFRW